MKPWQKLHPLSDPNAFICLVDFMGNDNAIVQAARVSYGKDKQDTSNNDLVSRVVPDLEVSHSVMENKDRQLIRYLLAHGHTTPFEMVEIKFMVQVPMDCWRQWVRHRTASINEYSTRYTEALDFFQITQPTEWRLQATENKQGSNGHLEEWTNEICTGGNLGSVPQIGSEAWEDFVKLYPTPGYYLSQHESSYHSHATRLYKERLALGVAKEQARKDLPLSTYTRAYWKCDLHNIFNFLRLRMDSHAQLEIRSYANSMFEIVKGLCPVACEAFEDYVLHARKFSRMEMEVLIEAIEDVKSKIKMADEGKINWRRDFADRIEFKQKPSSMTDREWKEFLEKLS